MILLRDETSTALVDLVTLCTYAYTIRVTLPKFLNVTRKSDTDGES